MPRAIANEKKPRPCNPLPDTVQNRRFAGTEKSWSAHEYVRQRIAESVIPTEPQEKDRGSHARRVIDWLIICRGYSEVAVAGAIQMGNTAFGAVRKGADISPLYYRRLIDFYSASRKDYLDSL